MSKILVFMARQKIWWSVADAFAHEKVTLSPALRRESAIQLAAWAATPRRQRRIRLAGRSRRLITRLGYKGAQWERGSRGQKGADEEYEDARLLRVMDVCGSRFLELGKAWGWSGDCMV